MDFSVAVLYTCLVSLAFLPLSVLELSCVCAAACLHPLHSLRLFVCFTVAANEKLLQTKSEGSDVSPAPDQLPEDKRGRSASSFKHSGGGAGHTSDR